MGRVITILFAFYFAVISSGVLFSKHYCGDRVSHSVWGVSIGSGSSCGCNHENSGHKKSCCKSETFVVKSEGQKFSPSVQFKLFKPALIGLLAYNSLDYLLNYSSHSADIISDRYPPPEPSSPLFILHRNLLI